MAQFPSGLYILEKKLATLVMEIPLKQNNQIIIMTIVVQKTLRKYERNTMLISVRIKVQLPSGCHRVLGKYGRVKKE
ncbi:unnamed protein product [Arctogadus glacialis]